MISPYSGTKDFTIYQGSTFRLEFQYLTKTSDGQTPIDMTGCVARMQLRQTAKSETIYFDLLASGCISIIDAENGKILINIPALETENFTFTRAAYDLELAYPDGEVERLLQGYINISSEVTR